MSYIGRGLDAISNVEKLDNITFDGGSTVNGDSRFTVTGATFIRLGDT
jgi:hypothetical protein